MLSSMRPASTAGSINKVTVQHRDTPQATAAEPEPVKTWLVSGFLGAGKTTFILERLSRSGGKVAVLVNEFGTLGIDGAVIRAKGGIDVVELPGGCVCCSRKEGLAGSVRSIAAKLQPELLLIEPSGIAETSEVLKVLTAPSLARVIRLDAAITVLDAETFMEYSEPDGFGTFFLDQVVHANLVLLNKSDLVSPEMLTAAERRIAGMNPAAVVQRTAFCQVEEEVAGGRKLPPAGCRVPLPMPECVSLVPGGELTETALELFLDELSRGQFGRVLRGKGIVPVSGKTMNLQIVSGRVELEPLTSEAGARVTLIGYDLDGERLRTVLGAGQGGLT